MNAEMQREPVRTKAVWGSRIRLAVALAGALLLTSCSEAVRTGQASSFLVLTSLTAGGSNVFQSDVRKIDPVTLAQSVTNDPGTAVFEVQMKDLLGVAPSANNSITITQYHVKFTRTDGRNTEGVDVPYAFDGAVTATVAATGSVVFTLV